MASLMTPNDETVLLIHGFGRNLKKRFNVSLPDQIVLVCATFTGLPVDEYFAHCGGKYDVEHDGHIIRNTRETWKDHSSFGNVWIHSSRERIHCWTFKVLKLSKRYAYLGIGIVDASKDDLDSMKSFWNFKSYYAVEPGVLLANDTVFGEDWEEHTQLGLIDGVIFKMELNLKTKELKFYVDDESLGAECTDIQCGDDIWYKMAISFGLGSVKLIDYVHSS